MRILMTLSNAFTHDQRVFLEARALAVAGHNVLLVAWDRNGIYPVEEKIAEIQIHRIRNNWLMKLAWRKPFQLFLFWKKAYNWALKQKFDAVHCHDLDTLMIGLKLKKQRSIKLVYDAHEIYTSLIQRDLTRIFTRFYEKLEQRAASRVDHLIIAENAYTNHFQKSGYSQITTVLNTKPIVSNKYQAPTNDVFTLLYTGTLSRARFLTELVAVVRNITDIKLVIAGMGPIENELALRCSSINNIEFLGPIPKDEVVPLTQTADAVVCMIDPDDYNNRIASANKQFEAMVAGRPIIATKSTRSGQITEEEKCGLVIDFNRTALKSAIISLRDDQTLREQLGKNALNAALRKYNWANDSNKLIQVYTE